MPPPQFRDISLRVDENLNVDAQPLGYDSMKARTPCVFRSAWRIWQRG